MVNPFRMDPSSDDPPSEHPASDECSSSTSGPPHSDPLSPWVAPVGRVAPVGQTDLGVPSEPKRPRVYTVWLLLLVAFVCYIQGSLIGIVVAEFFVLGRVAEITEEIITQVMRSRLGFCLMVIPSQLSIVLPPLVAAFLSPVPMASRLGLQRGHWPLWVWACAGIATPLIALVSGILVSGLVEESEHLKQTTEVFRWHATSGFLAMTLLLIAVMPAICEEVLFRGYVQTRFTQRMNPVVGVVLTSLLFAMMHMDPVHVLGVLPIGLWLGFLRYSGASLGLAVMGHGINNLLATVGAMQEDSGALDLPSAMMSAGILILGVPCLILTIAASRIYRPLREANERLASDANASDANASDANDVNEAIEVEIVDPGTEYDAGEGFQA